MKVGATITIVIHSGYYERKRTARAREDINVMNRRKEYGVRKAGNVDE